ncbi:hypothetical protein AcV5_007296 [Taiwanofungus camphoratus]|nr:hypothetical protein AcV5_007296 [Antrodia cinnamomea]
MSGFKEIPHNLHGDLSPTILSVLQALTSPDALSPENVHPFAFNPGSSITLLGKIIETTDQISDSLNTHLSLPLVNPKVLSLFRQHATISHNVYLSDRNLRQTLDSLRTRAGITYGEDIPLDRTSIIEWCISRLEAWGSLAGMEAFREEEFAGRMTVVLGGKVLVIDIDFAVERTDADNPKIALASLKTSYAIQSGAAGSTTEGSRSLDGFLADRLAEFLTEAQKEVDAQDSVRAARLSTQFSQHLSYLMRLDRLASGESDGGLRWFNDIDLLSLETEQFAASEAKAVAATLSVTSVPLDIFLMRAHALPLPYLTSPSISFLVHLSPLAYLSLLRTSKPSSTTSSPKLNLPKLDIAFKHLRSTLASHPRPRGVAIATLVLSSATTHVPNADTMHVSTLGTRPTSPLISSGFQNDHILPQIDHSSEPYTGLPYGWQLDFTDGGTYPGVVMSQSRMREIELVVNPLSAMDHIGNGQMLTFGAGSWVDLLLNPGNSVSPDRYTTLYISPTSAHPPLQLRLTAPVEPGFILETVPVRNLKEIWGILEIVKEQCWLNEVLTKQQWVAEGLVSGEEDMSDTEATEEDLQALLKGTLTPRRIPVNIYLPSVPASDPLFDSEDLNSITLSNSSQTHRTKIVMTSPERPPIPGLVEMTVAFDVSRPRGIALNMNGAMGADLQGDALEEVCRRGGLLSLPGRIWAKSHGAT